MFKKIVSLMVVLVMVLSLMTVGVVTGHAASVVDSGSCGQDAIWTLYSDGLLSVTGSGVIDKIAGEDYMAGYDESYVKCIIVNGQNMTVSSNAFSNFTCLDYVCLGKGVVSVYSDAFCVNNIASRVESASYMYGSPFDSFYLVIDSENIMLSDSFITTGGDIRSKSWYLAMNKKAFLDNISYVDGWGGWNQNQGVGWCDSCKCFLYDSAKYGYTLSDIQSSFSDSTYEYVGYHCSFENAYIQITENDKFSALIDFLENTDIKFWSKQERYGNNAPSFDLVEDFSVANTSLSDVNVVSNGSSLVSGYKTTYYVFHKDTVDGPVVALRDVLRKQDGIWDGSNAPYYNDMLDICANNQFMDIYYDGYENDTLGTFSFGFIKSVGGYPPSGYAYSDPLSCSYNYGTQGWDRGHKAVYLQFGKFINAMRFSVLKNEDSQSFISPDGKVDVSRFDYLGSGDSTEDWHYNIIDIAVSGFSNDNPLQIIKSSGDSRTSKILLTMETSNLRVTVPTVLPVSVDSDNNVTVADNAQISNLSNGQVDVTNAEIQTDEWSVVGFNTDFTKVPVNTKQYGFKLNGDDVSDGINASVFNTINGDDSIDLSYDANVAIQSQPITNEDIGRIVFTVAWHK